MAEKFQRLWKAVTSSNDEATAVRAMAEILADSEGRAFILSLDPKDAEYCFDILDHGIAGGHLKTTERQAFFVTLRRLAGIHGRLPDSMVITDKIEVGTKILASGGFSNVRSGTYTGHVVAVKSLKIAELDDFQKIRKQFCKEVVLWSSLAHPHVLKLIGVYGNMEKAEFTTVSEWMANGNIMEYIQKNAVNRLQLLHEAALGLKYIHSVGLTHGDLKGANILMTNHHPPRASLADFGFMTMVLDPKHPLSCSVQLEGGTVTFMSPELLVPSAFGVENAIPTPEADIYAFGLVILQVLTGEIPYRNTRMYELGYAVVQGLRPNRPENSSAIGFSDSLWDFVQRCWDRDMKSRPKVGVVVKHLAKEAAIWHGVMPPSKPETVVCVSEPLSDSRKGCGIFDPPSVILDSPTDSSLKSELFSYPGSPSTVCTEPALEEVSEAFVKPSADPSPDLWGSVSRRPQESKELPEPIVKPSKEPLPKRWSSASRRPQESDELPEPVARSFKEPPPSRWGSVSRRSQESKELPEPFVKSPKEPLSNRSSIASRRPQELTDDLQEFQHVGLDFQSPPTLVLPPRRRPFRRFKAKLRGLRDRLLSHNH